MWSKTESCRFESTCPKGTFPKGNWTLFLFNHGPNMTWMIETLHRHLKVHVFPITFTTQEQGGSLLRHLPCSHSFCRPSCGLSNPVALTVAVLHFSRSYLLLRQKLLLIHLFHGDSLGDVKNKNLYQPYPVLAYFQTCCFFCCVLFLHQI